MRFLRSMGGPLVVDQVSSWKAVGKPKSCSFSGQSSVHGQSARKNARLLCTRSPVYSLGAHSTLVEWSGVPKVCLKAWPKIPLQSCATMSTGSSPLPRNLIHRTRPPRYFTSLKNSMYRSPGPSASVSSVPSQECSRIRPRACTAALLPFSFIRYLASLDQAHIT